VGERDDRMMRMRAGNDALRTRNTELETALDERDEIIVGLRWEIEQRDARIDELERAAYGAKW
jgi:hypothetical protein